MNRCCFCDQPIAPRFHFCVSCKEGYDAALGPDWVHSDWFKETAKMSRRLKHLEDCDQAAGTTSLDALPAGDCTTMEPVQAQPQLADVLTGLLVAALLADPSAGWRRMYRMVQEHGVPATERQVRYRLDQVRAGVGQLPAVEVGG